jgi:hypothetical protein
MEEYAQVILGIKIENQNIRCPFETSYDYLEIDISLEYLLRSRFFSNELFDSRIQCRYQNLIVEIETKTTKVDSQKVADSIV